MNSNISLKLKALTMAVLINLMLLAGTAYLFDGKPHHRDLLSRSANSALPGLRVTAFRP